MGNLRLLFTSLFTLLISIIAGVFLLSQNADELKGKYLIGPDAYRYYRQARLIKEKGKLPKIDRMRHFPEGVDLSVKPKLLPQVLAYAYKIGHHFSSDLSLHQVAIYYPVIAYVLLDICLFLFAQSLFGYFCAMFAVFFLPLVPMLIHAFHVGYSDTNGLILLLFTLGIYLYYLAANSSTLVRKIVYSIASGMTIGTLGLAWVGNGICSLIVLGCIAFQICQERFTRGDLLTIFLWAGSILVFLLGATSAYTSHPTTSYSVLAIGAPLLSLLFAVFYKCINLISDRYSMRRKLPLGFISLSIVISIAALFISLIFRGVSWFTQVVEFILYPFGKNAVMQSVSELAPPMIGSWWVGYGILGILSVIALIGLFYHLSGRSFRRLIIFMVFTLLIEGTSAALIFKGYISAWKYKSTTLLLGLWASLFIAYVIFTLYAWHERRLIPLEHLIVLSWFFAASLLANSAIRFHLFLFPLIVILAGKQSADFFRSLKFEKPYLTFILFMSILWVWEMLVWSVDIINVRVHIMLVSLMVIIFLGYLLWERLFIGLCRYRVKNALLSFSFFLALGVGAAGTHGIGLAQNAWVTSKIHLPTPAKSIRAGAEWMKKSLPRPSVVLAPWDLGSLIAEIGRSSTIVDEEQNVNRIQQMTEAVLTGSEQQAAEFLEEYKITHILLTLKGLESLRANIRIALERFPKEKYSFPIVLSGTQRYVYRTMEFEDSNKINICNSDLADYDNDSNCEITYRITKISLPFIWENKHLSIRKPPSCIVKTSFGERQVKIREVIINKKQWYFPDAELKGTLWIIGQLKWRGANHIFDISRAFYLTSNARYLFLVKLFLGENKDRYKELYSSDDTTGVRIWKIRKKK